MDPSELPRNLLDGLVGICGLVPWANSEVSFSKMSPVGFVSIAVFQAWNRPHHNPHNVAMVYVVGPDSGGRVDVARTGLDSNFDAKEFVLTVSLVSQLTVEAVIQYNRDVAIGNKAQHFPSIHKLRR